MSDEAKVCVWTEGDDAWWTDCGHGFTFTVGGPVDSGWTHCCYCGGRLVAELSTGEGALDADPGD